MTKGLQRTNVLLVGPHGVVGGAIRDRLDSSPDWNLVSASRRIPAPASGAQAQHVSVDLLDADASTGRLAELSFVTHVVYAGYTERPTMAEMVGPNLAMLRHTIDALRTAGACLKRFVLIGGRKSYGEHLGPYKTPAKESDPRFLGPIFYNDQEDLLAEMASRYGVSWTVLRPDVVVGLATGSPMNLLMALGVYATLCKDAGVPLRFPGSTKAWTALHQLTDAGVLAAAVEWALVSPSADGEVFNVTNGDNFRWEQLWPDIAAVFEMPDAAPQPMSLVEQMQNKGKQWDSIVRRHGLIPTDYAAASAWHFADAIFATEYDMIQSTIKIRRAGFAGCVDTHTSVVDQLMMLRSRRYVA